MTKLVGWFFLIIGLIVGITGAYRGTKIVNETDTNKKIEAVYNNVTMFSGLIFLGIAACIFVSNENAGK